MAKILVVDDDTPVRSLIRDILEVESHDVMEAAHADEAFDSLMEECPDVIVLDIMLPGTSGIGILEQLRGIEDYERIPVIMLTAATDDATTWASWSAGADYYMTKPFDSDYLLDRVEHFLPKAS